MTIGFKVQVVIRYKDSLCALPLHSQSYYERISICRVSFTHQANSFENRDEKIENIVRKNEMTYSYLYDHSNFSSREQ